MMAKLVTAKAIAEAIKKRQISAEEICKETINNIEAIDPKVQAFITLNTQAALEEARRVDKAIAEGTPVGPLAGVPIALKDNLCTRNLPTTCASKMLEGWQPPYNATVVERLKASGMVLVGKVNMDEFAMGSSCENSAFKTTNNPWDLKAVTGGSSGGSAAAVAAGMVPIALGSDTGGSIRQPAAFCGVLGLKPTYGRVSRYGLVAFASSLDQIGPMARTSEDLALVMSIIAGHDPKDSTSAELAVPDYSSALGNSLAGMKIGLPKEYDNEGIHADIGEALGQARKVLAAQGAQLVDVSLPHTDYCLAAYYLIATAEASSNLARYDGVRYGLRVKGEPLSTMVQTTRAQGFGAEVKRRIMLGTYALSAGYYDAYYKKALQVRTLIQQDFNQAFQHCDVLLTPTSPTVAFKQGEKTDDPLTMYLSDIFTISINLAGLPGLNVPCGFSREGLPIGMQLIGRAYDESSLLKVAHVYQQQTSWHTQTPTLSIGGK